MSNGGNGKYQAKLEAFRTVESWGRLITTLSAGVLALSATFIRYIVGPDVEIVYSGVLFSAWVFLALSLVGGVLLLGALSHHLNQDEPEDLNIYASSIKWSGLVAWWAFILGIALFVLFVGLNL
ncbi:MAG: hypothetical protein E3J65_05970 [Dehalococcoidia bacterium]|nr:MAG: hypothetical protein E3J65_05970 [Dehalococcoidia bacterium]